MSKADLQVSVRKAAMTAAHKLLGEVPSGAGIAQLWLTITLPMVSKRFSATDC